MKNELSAAARTLKKGRTDRIDQPRGERIECLAGCLWVTQDGDLRDRVVERGEAIVLDRPGTALISALADSSYLLLVERIR
ncbi:DUF2917 domain-containing protein [Piscinibacter koreensis]|uniref:DUF2917 domain-containing protein n=1 Tax=Piscinibacter koreensis TaxID=2742824 RepID=A0A7Y6NRS5_9BURK|nr:DUF2917 domain-containing protein [Schlegelella koreensis]NUZ08146.1 DUF2917 domain-containing protein [Schlegelella koreensis]